MTAVELDRCPACRAEARQTVETVHSFLIVRCSRCGLEYTSNPEDAAGSYDLTYAGHEGVLEDPRPYASPAARLALERTAIFLPQPYLTAAERWVLRRIERRLAPGDVVFDIGCGTGRFLRALASRSFRPVGMDPAENVVRDLRRIGLDAFTGSAPEFSWKGPPPRVVTLFEVLEHLPDPAPTIKDLRSRFPGGAIGASVPSPLRPAVREGRRGATDYPPNHFLRWTPAALEEAFRRAGYRTVEVAVLPPVPDEFVRGLGDLLPIERLQRLRPRPASRSTGGDGVPADEGAASVPQRVVATVTLVIHRAWRSAARMGGIPAARRARKRGFSGSSLAVWAEP